MEQVCMPLPPWAVRAGARETIYWNPKDVHVAGESSHSTSFLCLLSLLPWVCLMCFLALVTWVCLNRHLRVVHVTGVGVTHKCSACCIPLLAPGTLQSRL